MGTGNPNDVVTTFGCDADRIGSHYRSRWVWIAAEEAIIIPWIYDNVRVYLSCLWSGKTLTGCDVGVRDESPIGSGSADVWFRFGGGF